MTDTFKIIVTAPVEIVEFKVTQDVAVLMAEGGYGIIKMGKTMSIPLCDWRKLIVTQGKCK